MFEICPAKLLYTIRDKVVDEEYFGFAALYKNFNLIKKTGDDNCAPFFLRSLSKPIQASFLVDSGLNLEDEEIAICCGSHSGTNEHVRVVETVLKKFNLDSNMLKCPPACPLDTKDFDGIKKSIYNNCSAKHALMLAISSVNGWDVDNYLDFNHPLQKLIYERHLEWSGAKSACVSLDGCGAPVFALTLDEIVKMFFKFFNDDKYRVLARAVLKCPYIFGGNNRLDSEIIELGKGNLFSKVGAGGLVLVYNFSKDEIFIVKMSQNNNVPRRIFTLNALFELNWIDTNPLSMHIYTQSGVTVGDYIPNFSFL